MKYGKDWVLKTAQCPEGMSWGLDYVAGGAKSLPEALAGFKRADWLLWYMVKTECLAVESAFDLLMEAAGARIDSDEIGVMLAGLRELPPDYIMKRRGTAAREAETLMTLGAFCQGHEYSVATFLLRFKLQLIAGDHDEALKDGQCVLNNLVAAKTGTLLMDTPRAKELHAELCEWLRSRVLIKRG